MSLWRLSLAHYYAFLPTVSVPHKLRSISSEPMLAVTVHNGRSESLQWWWVNYAGSPVYYSTIRSGSEIIQLTFATHPWLITTLSGDLVGVYIPYTANANISIE